MQTQPETCRHEAAAALLIETGNLRFISIRYHSANICGKCPHGVSATL